MKAIKSLFCIMLSAIMVFSCTSAAYAANDVTPVIVVHGLGGFPLYVNPNTDGQKEAYSFDVLSLLGKNNDALHAVRDAATGKIKTKKQIKAFIKEAAKVMEDYTTIACDKDGNSIHNVGIDSYWTDSMAKHKDYIASEGSSEPAITRQIADAVGPKNVYCFNYDWRLDAYDNGEKLDKFIDIVKKETGKDKVTLIGGSEGTIVVSAYVDKHKNDNELERVVYLNGAITGVSVTCVYAMDVTTTAKILADYMDMIFNTYKTDTLDMSKLAWLSQTTGETTKNLETLFKTIMSDKELTKMMFMDAFYPVFGCIPAYWEFIPYDFYDTAVKKMSGIGFLDKKSGLYDRIKRWHGIQGRAASNIKYLQKKGVDVAVIANYGYSAIPVTSQYANQTDVLIDTKYASVGATTADYGKTLPSSKTKNNKYASPDEIIDASTCATPDTTWFVKGVGHMHFDYNTEACKFVAVITTTTKKLNVASIKKAYGYDQFIGTNDKQGIVEIKPSFSTKVKSLKTGKKAIKVTLKKAKDVAGYQIEYSKNSDFSKSKKVKIKGYKTTKKTIKKLKKGTEYFVRVRAYKTVAGKKLYSDWSSAESIKVK